MPLDEVFALRDAQPPKDVPHEVEGRDGGQVPFQGIQHQQFPVLERKMKEI